MIDALWNIAPIVVAIALGYFAGFVTAAVLTVSNEVNRMEEWQAVRDDSAEVAVLKAELEEERANVEFYYRMATERM